MFEPLVLSSIAAGLIATTVMVLFLYLPRLWGGTAYDIFSVLGSTITGRANERSVVVGSFLFAAGGIAFAFLYGWIASLMIANGSILPHLYLANVTTGLPLPIDLSFAILGVAMGLLHGILFALVLTIVVIEHHPIERFRTRYSLVMYQVLGHMIYGATVMHFQSQFLTLFRAAGS